MKVLNQPELELLHTGNSLKTLQITALAGMMMPLHHSAQETVIVVQEGKAVLNMAATRHVLEKGIALIIPALLDHSLEIVHDFKAIAIMGVDSTIEFKKI